MDVRHTYTADEIEDPGMALIQRDYYNERARIAREELGGKSPIQALLEILTPDNSPKAEWSTNFRTEFGDGGGPLTHLYIVHNKYRKLLAENPEALIIDSTHRTNRYSMPPVKIVGMTSVNRSFYAGSRFMSGETYPDFLYLFENTMRWDYHTPKHSFLTATRNR
jgi:hypothetical protein